MYQVVCGHAEETRFRRDLSEVFLQECRLLDGLAENKALYALEKASLRAAAILALKSEGDVAGCSKDPVRRDQLIVEHFVEVLSFLAGPGDAAAGETWVHGTVESEDGSRGQAIMMKVVDATHTAPTFLCDSCHKCLIEILSDSECTDPQVRRQVLHLRVNFFAVPDLSIRQHKDPCVLRVDDAPSFSYRLVKLCASEISFKHADGFHCLSQTLIRVKEDAIRVIMSRMQFPCTAEADNGELASNRQRLDEYLECLPSHADVIAIHGSGPIQDEDEMEVGSIHR